jgi:hypothetical protein
MVGSPALGMADPVAETQETPEKNEPVEEERDTAEEAAAPQDVEGDGSSDRERQEKPAMDRTKSHATDASVTTTTTRQPDDTPKPWYKRYNPLRWGKIKPVPAERTPSPEYKAGFFSMLIFEWMAPLMQVRRDPLEPPSVPSEMLTLTIDWLPETSRAE